MAKVIWTGTITTTEEAGGPVTLVPNTDLDADPTGMKVKIFNNNDDQICEGTYDGSVSNCVVWDSGSASSAAAQIGLWDSGGGNDTDMAIVSFDATSGVVISSTNAGTPGYTYYIQFTVWRSA